MVITRFYISEYGGGLTVIYPLIARKNTHRFFETIFSRVNMFWNAAWFFSHNFAIEFHQKAVILRMPVEARRKRSSLHPETSLNVNFSVNLDVCLEILEHFYLHHWHFLVSESIFYSACCRFQPILQVFLWMSSQRLTNCCDCRNSKNETSTNAFW